MVGVANTGLYLIEILHQTTTIRGVVACGKKLYLIEILHQTTTITLYRVFSIPLYLIEILHQTTTVVPDEKLVAELYLIEILHQTTTSRQCCLVYRSCILSKFYIKPQLNVIFNGEVNVVSYRNSTSNHNYRGFAPILLYVVSYRNSTSNHNHPLCLYCHYRVVSYRNSTSNHNCVVDEDYQGEVVSYRNSTSNHNEGQNMSRLVSLYLIEILHQTTTIPEYDIRTDSCILSKFYIKPQQGDIFLFSR